MQAPCVLTESKGPLQWDPTEKYWQSGWREHLLLAWRYHKTWRQKKKGIKICALENQQPSSHPREGPAWICFPPRCIPDAQEVVPGEKGQFGWLQMLKKKRDRTSARSSSVLQICTSHLLLSFSLQRRAVHRPVPSPASVSPTSSRCREGVQLLMIFAPVHGSWIEFPNYFRGRTKLRRLTGFSSLTLASSSVLPSQPDRTLSPPTRPPLGSQ